MFDEVLVADGRGAFPEALAAERVRRAGPAILDGKMDGVDAFVEVLFLQIGADDVQVGQCAARAAAIGWRLWRRRCVGIASRQDKQDDAKERKQPVSLSCPHSVPSSPHWIYL